MRTQIELDKRYSRIITHGCNFRIIDCHNKVDGRLKDRIYGSASISLMYWSSTLSVRRLPAILGFVILAFKMSIITMLSI